MTMKRTVISLLFALFACATLSAQQTVVLNKDLDKFTSVSISDKFSFRLKNSPSYSVRIISDERIAEFIRPMVKNGTFSISIDEKKFSPELKKELKAKGAVDPFIEIEIYAPYINNLEMKGKSVLLDSERMKVDNFTLEVSGNAVLNRLYVDCVMADLSFMGSSQSNVSIEVDTKLNIQTENSSVSNVDQNGGNSICRVKGSSVLNLKVAVVDVDIETSGSSNTYISGLASMLDVKSSGFSMIDAESLEVKEGNFLQSGSSKCHANVEERMKVNLTGGCMLTFKRKPAIEVERILNSTLIKSDDPKRK